MKSYNDKPYFGARATASDKDICFEVKRSNSSNSTYGRKTTI